MGGRVHLSPSHGPALAIAPLRQFRLATAHKEVCRDQYFVAKKSQFAQLFEAAVHLELLGRLFQVHLSQFVQQMPQKRRMQQDTSPRASLGPYPQHLVVSLSAGSVIQFYLFDLSVPHAERTHQLFHLRYGNQIQDVVDQVRDWGEHRREISTTLPHLWLVFCAIKHAHSWLPQGWSQAACLTVHTHWQDLW